MPTTRGRFGGQVSSHIAGGEQAQAGGGVAHLAADVVGRAASVTSWGAAPGGAQNSWYRDRSRWPTGLAPPAHAVHIDPAARLLIAGALRAVATPIMLSTTTNTMFGC